MGMHTGTKGFPERALRSWMCRAIRSLPTPDSPVSITAVSALATRSAVTMLRRMASLW